MKRDEHEFAQREDDSVTPLVPNPMNQLARIAVGLLAIYWGVRGLLQIVASITSWYGFWGQADSERSISDFLTTVGIPSAFALVLSLLPAWILFRTREVVAESLAPINLPSPSLAITGADALCVGCLVLAISLGVGGATNIAVPLALAAFSLSDGDWDRESLARSTIVVSFIQAVASGGVKLIAAGLLWRYARRLSSKIASV